MDMPSTMIDKSGSIAMIYVQTEAEMQALASSATCRLYRVTVKFRNGDKDLETLGTNEGIEGRLTTTCQDLVTVVRMLEQSGRRAHEIWLSGASTIDEYKNSGGLTQAMLREVSKAMHDAEFKGRVLGVAMGSANLPKGISKR